MAKLLEAVRFVDMSAGCSYRYVTSDTEYFKEHTHDYYEIFIMLDGNAMHKINGETVPLTTGDAVFVRASDTHDYCAVGVAFSFLNFTFTRETLECVFAFLGDGYPSAALMRSRLCPSVHMTASQRTMLSREMEKITAISPEGTAERRTALRVLLIKLFSDVFSTFEGEAGQMPEWLSKLVITMQSDLSFTDGISRMVELSGKSREHLTRSVKKYLGKTPSEFINELRLNYIANMLRGSDRKILDIIMEAGFNSLSYASATFVREYGMSMSKYRERSIRENENR